MSDDTHGPIISPTGDHGGWIYPAGVTEFDLEGWDRRTPHPLSGQATFDDPPRYCPRGYHELDVCWTVTAPARPPRRSWLGRLVQALRPARR